MKLSNIKAQAEQLSSKNISYNQALQQVAQTNGFKSYQALLVSIEKEYCKDDDENLQYLKKAIFKNRKHIQSNIKKIIKLWEDMKKLDDYDLTEDMYYKILALESSTMKMISLRFYGVVTLFHTQKLTILS